MTPLSDCGTDLWQIGNKDFLVLVDRYSGYIMCKQVRNKTSAVVIEQLTEWMLNYHPILRLRSDGGPAYKSQEFSDFCVEFGIVHEISSAYFAPSDGISEAGVNVCKRLQRKSMEEGTNFRANLQCLNNYPRKSPAAGFPMIASPAEMFFSTGQRDFNPRLGSNEPDLAMSAISREKQRVIMRERSHRKNVVMSPLVRNDLVWLQDPITKFWDRRGKIMTVRPSGMSFLVMKENGKISRRNRKFLKLRQAAQTDEDIDIECASVIIVENLYSDCTPRRKESCLRGPTESRRRTGSHGTGAARKVSFGSVTRIGAVGRDGELYNIQDTVRLAPKTVRWIPSVAGG
jgi:transposase InsO family protein